MGSPLCPLLGTIRGGRTNFSWPEISFFFFSSPCRWGHGSAQMSPSEEGDASSWDPKSDRAPRSSSSGLECVSLEDLGQARGVFGSIIHALKV